MAQELLREMNAGVLWLTLNRPERRNALTPEMLSGLREGIQAANADREVRAIVITGAGDVAFCAGADLQTGKSFAFDYSQPHQAYADVLRAARACNVPLIARVNGVCMAGGMGLLAMCDLAVAAPHAKFGLPEVKVGVFPAQVTAVLQPILPPRILAELCITGEPIGAAEALDCGLVNYVDADLDGRMTWLLSRICDKSPSALRRGIYTLKHLRALPFEAAMAFTESQIGLLALTADAQEGQLAFREKRMPVWPNA